MRVVNIAGQRFGKLIAIERMPRTGAVISPWLTRCDCGATSIVALNNLRGGHTKSCGCAKRDLVSQSRKRHGHSLAPNGKSHKTPTYNTWVNIRGRCGNPNSTQYRWYGARGIKVCKEWEESFETFLRDMGERPSAKHSIERINNDGDYAPHNCRWATFAEQIANRRKPWSSCA